MYTIDILNATGFGNSLRRSEFRGCSSFQKKSMIWAGGLARGYQVKPLAYLWKGDTSVILITKLCYFKNGLNIALIAGFLTTDIVQIDCQL